MAIENDRIFYYPYLALINESSCQEPVKVLISAFYLLDPEQHHLCESGHRRPPILRIRIQHRNNF